MSKNLVIVESPAKAKTIEGYLGKDFMVRSLFGHVRDLPKENDAIDVKNGFKPTYVISPDKIKVVNEIASALGLENIKAEQMRAELVEGEFDFVVSRAVTRLLPFYGWVKGKININNYNKYKNGILCLKGGDLKEELKELGKKGRIFEISEYFEEEFFETKLVVHIAMT